MEISLRTLSTWAAYLALAYFCINMLRALQFHFFYTADLSMYKSRAGGEKAWALVTGASDGIGKGLARELCRNGFNVILHGRNEKKLLGLKADFNKEFPNVEVKVLVVDAGSANWDEKLDATILAAVKGLNLTMLINNVGGGGGIEPAWAPVTQRSAHDLDIWIDLNLRFMTQITRVLLPVLTRDKTQRTVVVNVSSAAELVAAPYLVTYSAAKAYVSRWTEGLAAELKDQGHTMIDLHSLIVGSVVTENTGRDESSIGLFSPAVPPFAKVVLSKLGCGQVVCTPYWPHALQVWFLKDLMPRFVANNFMLSMAREDMARLEKLAQQKAKGK
jgi:17beta-estradiol 17-dehydrogenase / very-long-chain 3-oxoacyl-CoA reductase